MRSGCASRVVTHPVAAADATATPTPSSGAAP